MDKYSGKTGNQVLQMAIEAKSFDEMKEHLEGLRYKQALDKSRLPELVETAKRIANPRGSKPSQSKSVPPPARPPREKKPYKPDYWPTTLVEQVDARGKVIKSMPQLRARSPLGYVGYKVGHTEGLSKDDRRDVLTNFFESKLHPRLHEIFSNELGQPSSMVRLLKMANIIAGVCKLAKRRNDSSLDYSIDCWEEDLEFLKENFFIPMQEGRRPRRWPSS